MYKTLRTFCGLHSQDLPDAEPNRRPTLDQLQQQRVKRVLRVQQLLDMKSVPLLLLLSSVLLSSHLRPAAGRPRFLPGRLDGSGRLQAQQLDGMLLKADADGTASEFLGDNVLRILQRRDPDHLHLLPEEEGEEEALRAAAQLLKRSEEPPLSIDLTFHLLRNMIQMAKMESQREQAQLNRKVLDEVGK